MFDSASSFSALVGTAVGVVTLFRALLSFVESARRAYRLKVSNAAPSISTSSGTIPETRWFLRVMPFDDWLCAICRACLMDKKAVL
jgi:hypothetical protein